MKTSSLISLNAIVQGNQTLGPGARFCRKENARLSARSLFFALLGVRTRGTHQPSPVRACPCSHSSYRLQSCLPAFLPACLPVSVPRSPPHHLPAIFSLHRLRKSPRALTADESNAPSRGTWSTVDHRTDVKPTISRRFADATDVPTQPPDTSAPWRPTTTQQ